MRKRISCRVVRSVPLGKSDDGLQNANGPSVHRLVMCPAALFYTDRLVVTRTCIDERPATQVLDLYV
jgi:hypothetical protein